MRLTLNWISACSVHLSDLSIWYKFKGKFVAGALLCSLDNNYNLFYELTARVGIYLG